MRRLRYHIKTALTVIYVVVIICVIASMVLSTIPYSLIP